MASILIAIKSQQSGNFLGLMYIKNGKKGVWYDVVRAKSEVDFEDTSVDFLNFTLCFLSSSPISYL